MAHLEIGGVENPAPEEWTEHILCDRYKWPLEYVRGLTLPDVLKLLTVLGHANRAANSNG